jgi:hypothetical protein
VQIEFRRLGVENDIRAWEMSSKESSSARRWNNDNALIGRNAWAQLARARSEKVARENPDFAIAGINMEID